MPKLPDDPEQVRMSFSAHLEELRGRILRALALLVGLFLVGWILFRSPLEALFIRPHRLAARGLMESDPTREIGEKLSILSPVESVFFDMKIAGLGALLIGFPYLLYQLWSFVAVGLYPRERKAVGRYVPWAMILGIVGILFGYFFMIPKVLEFLYAMPNPDLMMPNYRLKDYFSIFLMFTLALTLVFQLPLLMMGLAAAGIVDAKLLRRYRRHFILGAFVIAAVFTPPDPISQVFMAIPTVLLYEASILLVSWRAARSGEKVTGETGASA